MKKTLLIYKPIGKTPLEMINLFKENNPKYGDETISYAGRLDPMAEGLLLLLIGDENKNRKHYQDLPKTYETEFVFGITTDTFDAMGLIEKASFKIPNIEEVKALIEGFVGKKTQEYPPYSSKAVSGKPLFWWARNNKLSEISIPKRRIEIYKIEVLGYRNIAVEDLVKDIEERIKTVTGNFRQEEILKQWQKTSKDNKAEKLLKVVLKIECSSGTYIRRLASDIGETIKIGAFCLSIKRTRIGSYKI